MVVAAFPLAKIGLLLMKQLSKPLANIIKNEAKRHATVRKYIIVPTGRAYQWVEYQIAKSLKGAKEEISRPSEEEAVEMGANAIGEIVLFGILCAILMAEFNRQGDKKAVQERTKAEEIQNLQDTLLDLLEDFEKLKKTVKNIQNEIAAAKDVFDYEDRTYTRVVNDHNFWDVYGDKNVDPNSPSI